MGHIELAAPVISYLVFQGIPSKMGLLGDIFKRSLKKLLYFESYIVINPGDTGFKKSNYDLKKNIAKYSENYNGP